MPVSPFHPVIDEWFETRFQGPTPPQRDAWPLIRRGDNVLLAAPTGSGKTLAAFLSAIDELFREGERGDLREETRVLYVSPLKALSRDIEFNLQRPLVEISELALARGVRSQETTTALRTGDTSAADRAKILKHPPHVLVTTPESLYLLLTSEGGRRVLRTIRTVIVDEIHALLSNKRGAHLALSLERLEELVTEHGSKGPQRVGLSATQNPIETVAAFLAGNRDGRARPCEVVNHGHGRTLDLKLCMPRSPLEAVMSAEAQTEMYDQLAELIRSHKSTLVFTNTRKLAERLTRFLAERLGQDSVTSHHGSLSKRLRESAERRLREGRLRALVATASLELGIDVGDVDLVCQIGSPGTVSSFLQRVGRSGHTRYATPKGRLFPQSRDDHVECLALLDCVRRGELDRIEMCERPLDILAQQLVAHSADASHPVSSLLDMVRRAAPYAKLDRERFDRVLFMVAEGFATSRGRRGAFLHFDETTDRVRGRRGARLAALTSGGAIPDNFDYDVLLAPTETRIGSLNEDFAIESNAGDIFQLGNTSYQIEKIEPGIVRVRDAAGAPPNLPFWLGEAPSRSDVLSLSVARFRQTVDSTFVAANFDFERTLSSLSEQLELPREALQPAVEYLGQSRMSLGFMPTQETLVVERFFDETGSMHLVIHSCYGMRVNRAFALSLRKRFCRSFNVELQAAAGEDAILLSLGPMHSFPLEQVWHFIGSKNAESVLVQALLDSPLFQTRFRWNASRSLAVLRYRGGKKKPPRFQRLEADDLLALCFPDQVACQENLIGDREIPDHPLVTQTIEDSLTEAMDLAGLTALLRRIEAGDVHLRSVDVTEPSAFAHEILTAKPYTFLDDAPLEERRAQAVYLRRQGLPESARELGRLEPAAISDVIREAEPDPRDPDELHDALSVYVFATLTEVERWEARAGRGLLAPLLQAGRAVTVRHGAVSLVSTRKFETTLLEGMRGSEAALREVCRGRLEWCGPITALELGDLLGLESLSVTGALAALEAEGFLLRGHFRVADSALGGAPSPKNPEEFCERRLLARIHRKTVGRLRAQIQPATIAQFVEFLCHHQGVTEERRRQGLEGTWAVIEQLSGFAVPAGAWESAVLSSRVRDYSPAHLDQLSLTGRVAWRAAGNSSKRLTRKTPVLLSARSPHPGPPSLGEDHLSDLGADARRLLETLRTRGASFFPELIQSSGLLPVQGELAVSELAGRGLCTTDGISGLRTLIASQETLRQSQRRSRHRRPGRSGPLGLEWAGRIGWAPSVPEWSTQPADRPAEDVERDLEDTAERLLRRWGVIFRKLLTREPHLPPWRELLRVLFRLEAQGRVRGGRFVGGVSGEQFALPEAVSALRAVRTASPSTEVLRISPADPLNLVGILTSAPLVQRSNGGHILIVGGEFVLPSSGAHLGLEETRAVSAGP